MTTENSEATVIGWDELPEPITTYLVAHAGRDTGGALAAFTTHAVVTDEGCDHRGRAEIEAWLNSSAGAYSYTTEFTGANALDTTSFDVVQHLEGDFPGGVADLHYRCTLEGGRISRLVIEP
ncbi:nuclear transport factor 2 family protein [Mycolicibacterium sp. OfavD-34-C]|uniref:nuclear transport factor 2 family protein n=1 Tax=Mycolicibacterium sp. OfavD-34-C TaxID=2917746 RepID=UPI001EF63C15|nr:nuclear transport factor 2 family protein [Mycolicibacterium sp. OfavD-34-C]MCG7581470.1 nuclear transport factor 2 family protein [Mycolicibacterium sp. OfavD-34-C]